MTETWLDTAIRKPGPGWKQGYSGFPSRRLDQILGEVKHSSGGSISSTFRELARKGREASWTISIAKSGVYYQHYPLEVITWHCGRRGSWTDPGNVSLVGVEHEGGAPGRVSEPLTPQQLETSIFVSSEIRRLCSKVRASPPMTRINLFEHNWVSDRPTACPSFRIPWSAIMLELSPLPTLTPKAADGKVDKRLAALEKKVRKLTDWAKDF